MSVTKQQRDDSGDAREHRRSDVAVVERVCWSTGERPREKADERDADLDRARKPPGRLDEEPAPSARGALVAQLREGGCAGP